MLDSASRERPSRTLRARSSPTPSTACRSSIPADEQLLQAAEVLDQPLHHRAGQPGDLGEQPVAPRGDRAVEVLARAQPERPGDRGDVDEVGGAEPLEVGEHVLGLADPTSGWAGSRGSPARARGRHR